MVNHSALDIYTTCEPHMHFGQPNSSVLLDYVSKNCGRLSSSLQRLWTRDDLKDIYPRFLILMHQIVRASVPLLSAAHHSSVSMSVDNDQYATLAEYYLTHTKEEENHDVWFLDDLADCGFDRNAILRLVPSPIVASLVGSQYYWISHYSPISLLGYIIILEGNPPSNSHIQMLREKTLLPDCAFRTYTLHGDSDPTHVNCWIQALDKLQLSFHDFMLLQLSALNTANQFAICLDNIEMISCPNST
jgi:hypothetical protein